MLINMIGSRAVVLNFKGVVVVFQMPVGHFEGRIRTQWGRLPLYTSSSQKSGILRKFSKTLYLCAKFSAKNDFRRML